MELMQETDDISCREEEEEEEEEITREESSSKNQHHHYNSPFSSPSLSLSSSPSTINHHHHHAINNIPLPHQQQIPWFNMNIHDHHHHQNSPESHNSSSGLGLKQLDFMELSLGNNKDDPSTSGGVDPNPTTSSSSAAANHQVVQVEAIEKEHMFDKAVTPSDVGKLNRLVIPKQHAEKYFPLDSTTNEKGLLLNFEDRNGKLWRFRYSYWNSSQSYVMTKGWSRFVKEKKLDAGDIVSFQRGVGELYRHRLYIDWKRRSNQHHHHHQYHDPSTTLFTPFFLPNPNQPPHYSMIRWGAATAAPATTARLYSTSPHTPRHYNYHMYHPFNQQQNHASGASGSGNHSQYNYNEQQLSSSSAAAGGGGGGYYMRSAATSMPIFSDVQRQQQEGRGVGGANISLSPMIIDSVPVAHHHNHSHYQQQQLQQQYGGNKSGSNTAAKRLRLFGVNMECGSSTNEDAKANSIPSSSSSLHQHEDNLSVSPSTTRFGDQREEAPSMLFDLDPSLQYRQ